MNAFYVITKNEIGMNISRSKKDVLLAGMGVRWGGGGVDSRAKRSQDVEEILIRTSK